MNPAIRELACKLALAWNPHTVAGRFVRWYIVTYLCNPRAETGP